MSKALAMSGLYQPLVALDLSDPHIWYSNDFPWSQDVKFDLGLGWPQATSEFQNVRTASKRGSWKPACKKTQPRKI